VFASFMSFLLSGVGRITPLVDHDRALALPLCVPPVKLCKGATPRGRGSLQ